MLGEGGFEPFSNQNKPLHLAFGEMIVRLRGPD